MNRHTILLAVLTFLVSCSERELENSLLRIDDIVAERHRNYSDYEMRLNILKDSLDRASLDSMKWVWADSLYYSYLHYNLDSTFEYASLLRVYATDLRQEYSSILSEVRALTLRHNEVAAENLFKSLSPESLELVGMQREYLSSAIELYLYMKYYSKHYSQETCESLLVDYRERYLAVDTVSFYSKRVMAHSARDEGDYRKALKILQEQDLIETIDHNKASIAYNMASVYGALGMNDMRLRNLVKAVEYDFRCPVRDYLSLYELALMLYERNDLRRAERYITDNLSDAVAGNFNTRMINSATYKMIIAQKARHEDRTRLFWLLLVTSCFVVMFVIMCLLFIYNRMHVKRLNHIKDVLLETNKRLKKTNDELNYANKIKDSYVFSYMELSVRYLEKIEDTRKNIKAAGKSGGLEQVMKMLRSPSEIYDEYKRYYQIFDEAFLGIFPDFVQKVNSLLEEGSRFPIPQDKTLCTELRMLAAIRLGIIESGKIATFLKCSPATVYSYKSRLKSAAICPKNEFERKISNL